MKKQLLQTAFLMLLSSAASAGNIVIKLANQPTEGQIAVALYDATDVDDYEVIVRRQRFALKSSNSYQLRDIPAGRFALRLYIDENSNNELDTNFMGIPVEPVGYSNNYQPNGFPRFKPAVFQLNEDELLELNISAEPPIKHIGQFAAGLGIHAWQSPYRERNAGMMVVPVLTYIGERVQFLGPEVRYELGGSERLGLTGILSYRFPAYAENDSEYLLGLGDREGATMLGFKAHAMLTNSFTASISYSHDVLDTIGGSVANIELRNTRNIGKVQWYLGLGFNWLSDSISAHEFGVPAAAATTSRAAYNPDNVTSVQTTLGATITTSSNWRFVFSVLVDFYNEEAANSPIVDSDHNTSVFSAATYSF